VIGQVADAGLDDDGPVVEANDNAPGIDDVIVFKYADGCPPVQRFLKILIGRQANVQSHGGVDSFVRRSRRFEAIVDFAEWSLLYLDSRLFYRNWFLVLAAISPIFVSSA